MFSLRGTFQNPQLRKFVNDVTDSTKLSYPAVLGSMDQIYAGIGLDSKAFGDEASIYATTGVIYHTTDEFESHILRLHPDLLIAHKPVGSADFRELLGNFYRWSSVVQPFIDKPDEDILHYPLPLEPNVDVSAAFYDWIATAIRLHAFTDDEMRNILEDPAKYMRDTVKSTNNNFGKVLGNQFSLEARQAIQDGLKENQDRFTRNLLEPFYERGTAILFIADNYMEKRAEDGKPVSLMEWAGEHNPEGAANVLFSPQDEAKKAGAVVLGTNRTYYTPDGRIMVVGVPFFKALSTEMRDPERRAGVLKPFQDEIRNAKERGQHPIFVSGIMPYLKEAQAWRGDPEASHSWSNVTGAVTTEGIIGQLDVELIQAAHIPDPRRNSNKEPIPPDNYWVVTPDPSGALRMEGDIQKGDKFYLHNREQSISMGVVHDRIPMGFNTRSLPPRTIYSGS